MRAFFLFEFCEQTWIPRGARECLYEIMDACNSGLRSFNRQVAQMAIQVARDKQVDTIIELGAGRGPITKEMVNHHDTTGMRLVPCDLLPNVAAYQKLQADHPERVFPIYTPVDLTQPQFALDDAVLVLSTMMHHVPFHLRSKVLQTLTQTNSNIVIIEPLLRTWLSILLAALSFFPAALLPIIFIRHPGKLRRILWCWVVPIVPFMFAWDGVISCLRQWKVVEWQAAFAELPQPPTVEFEVGFNFLKIEWSGTSSQPEAAPASPIDGLGVH